jgi:hypothetical protein
MWCCLPNKACTTSDLETEELRPTSTAPRGNTDFESFPLEAKEASLSPKGLRIKLGALAGQQSALARITGASTVSATLRTRWKVLLPREQKDFMTSGITNLLGPLHGYLIYFFMGSISSRIEYYVRKNDFFFFF